MTETDWELGKRRLKMFEADLAYIDIYQQANTSIYVVDDYMNTKTLQLLSQKKQGVEVVYLQKMDMVEKVF